MADTQYPIQEYHLDATLSSGQAFRWRKLDGAWMGVVGRHWVRLKLEENRLQAQTALPVANWQWLEEYLQVQVVLPGITTTFPADGPIQKALQACRGLRLLRQDPWECLASFILSSTKQIVQIRQIVELICRDFGEPIVVPSGYPPQWAFPSPERLAQCSEAELRACKMGFRAGYLQATAQWVAGHLPEYYRLGRLPIEEARCRLMNLPGVGRKIADCVLLFAFGFDHAFPIDVWVRKALSELYFPGQKLTLSQMHAFAASHFGPFAGYAQQYLFHFLRTNQ